MASLVGSFLGQDQAEAARKAAADTYAKQGLAIQDIKNAGTDYADKFAKLGTTYQPFVDTGLDANTQLHNLISDPSSVRSLPGYQFNLEEGLRGVDNGASARHMLNSSRNMRDETRFASGLADNTYGQQFARLSGASGAGVSALNNENSTIGTGLTGELGTRTSAYNGAMNAAGTIGQGDVAAAGALGAGAGNVVNLGLNLAKLAAGVPPSAGGGGTPGAGSSPSMGGAGTGYDSYGRQFSYGG